MRLAKRILPIAALAALFATTLYAASGLSRDALRKVELTCLLNDWVTGSPFPCLSVDRASGIVVLRAPFQDTHVVVVPVAAVTGIEAPELLRDGGPNYLQDAWDARSFVEAEVKRPLGWDDVGLAVNSRSTRSQDQLHVHVDCVDWRVKRALKASLAGIPTDRWQEAGLVEHGHRLWARRIDAPDLGSVNLFRLADAIPGFAPTPAETLLAVVGTLMPDGRRSFVALAAQSDPARAAGQFTSEHLLDHDCRAP